jgi:hypothetical protein
VTIPAELFKFFGQAVVVVAGWWVVHQLSTARDRDKARREMVAKSADLIADGLGPIILEAREYHLRQRDVARELKLKMGLQDLAMRATGLSQICADEFLLAACRSDVASLRRAITGSHFEDEHVEPLAESADQLEAVAESMLRAKRSLLKLKHHQFAS